MDTETKINKLSEANRRMNGRIQANQNNDKYYRQKQSKEFRLVWATLSLIIVSLIIVTYGTFYGAR